MSSNRKIAVLGSGGHALSVLDAAEAAGFTPTGVVDQTCKNSKLSHLPLFTDINELNLDNTSLCLGVGTNFLREQTFINIKKKHPKAKFPVVLHPTSYISTTALISEGAVILAQSYVGPGCIVENGAIVNTGASLDHDSHLKSFSSLGPGARTGGNVLIGDRTAIGINCSIIQGASIGADTVIGAQSLILKGISDLSIAFGSPCVAVRPRKKNEYYY